MLAICNKSKRRPSRSNRENFSQCSQAKKRGTRNHKFKIKISRHFQFKYHKEELLPECKQIIKIIILALLWWNLRLLWEPLNIRIAHSTSSTIITDRIRIARIRVASLERASPHPPWACIINNSISIHSRLSKKVSLQRCLDKLAIRWENNSGKFPQTSLAVLYTKKRIHQTG